MSTSFFTTEDMDFLLTLTNTLEDASFMEAYNVLLTAKSQLEKFPKSHPVAKAQITDIKNVIAKMQTEKKAAEKVLRGQLKTQLVLEAVPPTIFQAVIMMQRPVAGSAAMEQYNADQLDLTVKHTAATVALMEYDNCKLKARRWRLKSFGYQKATVKFLHRRHI